MNRWRVGEDRGSKEMDGCPLTGVLHPSQMGSVLHSLWIKPGAPDTFDGDKVKDHTFLTSLDSTYCSQGQISQTTICAYTGPCHTLNLDVQ
jgi:hypothetical protein